MEIVWRSGRAVGSDGPTGGTAAILDGMAPVLLWIVVALVSAAAVFVVASLAGGGSGGVRQFLADLRAGLRRGRDDGEGGVFADARKDLVEAAEAESSSVDEIFVIGEPQESAYLGTEDIARTLGRATGRVRGPGRPGQD